MFNRIRERFRTWKEEDKERDRMYSIWCEEISDPLDNSSVAIFDYMVDICRRNKRPLMTHKQFCKLRGWEECPKKKEVEEANKEHPTTGE